MSATLRASTLAGLLLSTGCGGVPPLNTATISTVPVSQGTLAEARRALRACAALPNSVAMFDRFEAMGYRSPFSADSSSVSPLPDDRRLVIIPYVSHDTGRIIAYAEESGCAIGVRGMTPEQSYRLASTMAESRGAKTNAELGQGLSPHVVQAWRVRTPGGRMVYIAAHKSWPWDFGDWPDEPGAAVTVRTN